MGNNLSLDTDSKKVKKNNYAHKLKDRKSLIWAWNAADDNF